MQTEEKMVDIDTSGPDTEIELQDDQVNESEVVESTKETEKEETPEASPEPQEASDEQQESSEPKDEKKEELETYSKDVQRRIAKLTKKWREAERQRDEALTFAKTQKEQREALQKRYSSVEEAGVKDREAMIQAGLSAAQAKLAAARESGDIQAEVDANKEIAMLGYQEAKLQEIKSSVENSAKLAAERKEDLPNFNQRVQQEIPADPKAEAWGAKNPWFGKDTAMTYTAFDLHKKLVDDEGYDPASDEYYSELDKRLRVEFPHKFANTSDKVSAENSSSASTKPVQQVASATRSTKTGRKTVRLTPSQVAIAKKLGVPLEEYAKQLKLTKEV